MRINNPYRDDSSFDAIRRKWGNPRFVAIVDEQFHRFVCANCGAGWIGPPGDYCDWCHERWILTQKRDIQRLLQPEWMGWGERYEQLGELDRRVWEQTRGFHGNYQGKWNDEVCSAAELGRITGDELDQALSRYERWTIHMQKSESESPNGT